MTSAEEFQQLIAEGAALTDEAAIRVALND